MTFTDKAEDIGKANFHIITVPTPSPIQMNLIFRISLRRPRQLENNLKPATLWFMSQRSIQVAPKMIAYQCLRQNQNLQPDKIFTLVIHPSALIQAIPNHRFETIMKIVSAQCSHSLKIVADTYGAVVTAGIYQAPSIKVAEAAKVIENTQRDLNIGFVNELSKIFNAMGVDTYDVLQAAGTKWNFNAFEPGLVGGHCIGVDPYYLTSKALKIGAQPKIILSQGEIQIIITQAFWLNNVANGSANKASITQKLYNWA